MKKMTFLIFLILQVQIIHAQKLKENDQFVEFAHTGIINKIIRPLFISTTKLQLKLDKQQEEKLKTILQRSHRKITSEQYLEIVYETIITDRETFSAIKQFIICNKKYYTNNTNLNNDLDAESYDIYIDSTKHFSIYYKLKNNFFYDMRQFLTKRNCDNKVVSALRDK
jgi:hypothetical protein